MPGPGDARDPFAPGAVLLPEADLSAPDPRPTPRPGRPGRVDRLLRGAIVVLLVAAEATVVVAGSFISGLAYGSAAFIAGVAMCGIAVRRAFGRSGIWQWAAAYGIFTTAILRFFLVGLPPASSIFVIAVALAGAALTVLLMRRAERVIDATGVPRDARRREIVLERHRLAGEWNQVRGALTTAGSTVEQLVEPSSPDGGRCVTLDRRGRTSVRHVEVGASEGAWLVFDAHGALLAMAPRNAPDAWTRVMKQKAPTLRGARG
ncbi:MAG: hypothetical protein HGA44_02995 [Cellulomonadaceae bacterium]|nr:hypothetical protein [Cellulomonadaceae bacterium]